LTALGMGLLGPVLPAYALSLGASAALVGLLLSGFGVARLVVSLSATWLVHHVGYRRLLVGSPTLIAPAALLCAVVGGFWGLALFCLIEGAAAAAYGTAGTATIVAVPDPRSRGLSSYQSAGLIGASAGPLLGGLIAQQFGPQAPFLVYAAIATAAAWWLQRRLDHDGLMSAGPDRPGGAAAAVKPSNWRTLAAPQLLPLWLLAFALVFARLGTQLVVAPLLGGAHGLSVAQIGFAFALSGFATLVVFYPAGRLMDRYGCKAVITAGGLGVSAALVVLAFAGGYAGFLVGSLVLGASSGLAGPAPLAYVAGVLGGEQRTRGVGIYRALGDAGAVLAPPLLGGLITLRGYDTALLMAAAPLLLATTAFAWRSPAAGPTA